ncbi:hypothetical protein HS7_17310 [Sulfolobales archaeon HS-7]|nr:hypothetical protein HS7_17310 [Sulfolobales archaeon HS-7]
MELLVENCNSRTGKHRVRTILVKVADPIVEVKNSTSRCEPIYKVGECHKVKIGKETYIFARFVRNIHGKVRGKIIVYSNENEALVFSYRKLKLKYVKGEKRMIEYVKKFVEQYKIPVKKIN